jgi:hypothetical protein
MKDTARCRDRRADPALRGRERRGYFSEYVLQRGSSLYCSGGGRQKSTLFLPNTGPEWPRGSRAVAEALKFI